MTKAVVLIVCNALDDATRLERGITTDSPAASRKVFMLGQALRLAGVRPIVLSLGRGRTDGSLRYFPRVVCRVCGIPVIYAPFSHLRFASEVISFFAFVGATLRFWRKPQRAVIYYNRLLAYLPTLYSTTLFGYRNILDLEDGEVSGKSAGRLKSKIQKFVCWNFDRLCNAGALLACKALSRMTKIRPIHCYYGTSSGAFPVPKCDASELRVLMSGTIAPDTGADLLIEAIRALRQMDAGWARHLRIDISGQGSSIETMRTISLEPGFPQVQVHGRLSDSQYRELLNSCDVGVALKPIGGPLADTTFPSKVIEFASSGLLVLSTDISDVRLLMGSGAVYLTRNDPEELIVLLQQICTNRALAAACAKEGHRAVASTCAAASAGDGLIRFIFESPL